MILGSRLFRKAFFMRFLSPDALKSSPTWKTMFHLVKDGLYKDQVKLGRWRPGYKYHSPTVQKSWPGTRLPGQKSCDVTASSAVSHGTHHQAGVWGHKETSSGRPAAIGRFPSCAALPLLERAAEAAALSSAALWRLAVHITAWLMCGLKQFSEEDGTLFSRKGMHTSESLTRNANTGRCLWISPARWLF